MVRVLLLPPDELQAVTTERVSNVLKSAVNKNLKRFIGVSREQGLLANCEYSKYRLNIYKSIEINPVCFVTLLGSGC